MNNRYIVLSAEIISTLFTPFYMPTVAFVVLLTFSYLSRLTFAEKCSMTLMVYVFTVLFPRIAIFIYRKYYGWSRKELNTQNGRYAPYIISIVCYSTLLVIMNVIHMPRFTMSIVGASLLIQIICALVNNIIKVSTHAAASGGVIGMLFAFSLIFNFNAVW